MRPLALLLVVPAALAPSRPAEACSPPLCWPGAFLPGDGATIPANAPGLYWRPALAIGASEPDPDPATVTLTAADDPGTELSFTATELANGDYVLVPDAPLVEGTTYVLEDVATCAGTRGPSVMFTAGPSAPLPTSLGSVGLIGHGVRLDLEVGTAVGSCSTTVDATTLTIELAPSPEAEPWMALLLFQTIVDDQPWEIQESIRVFPGPGESWQGRGRDLLFRICEPNPDSLYPGLAPAGHEVAFRASLPGSATSLSTANLAVELMCDPRPDPDPDPDDNDASGGGCTTTTADPSLLLLLLAGFAFVLRRRR